MRWPWARSQEVAQASLDRAEKDDEKVRAVVDKAIRLRERNGFGEAVMRSMGGGK